MEASRAPKGKGKWGYPDEYRNDEGKGLQRYALYEPWEYMSPERLKNEGHSKVDYSQAIPINGGYPTGGFRKPTTQDQPSSPDLAEYAVSTKAAGHIPFDYQGKPTPAVRVERPLNKGDRKPYAVRPFNDPGTVRANTSLADGHLVGVTYHPEGNSNGFVRAPMGPLNRQAGQHMRQHQDMDSRPVIRRWDAAQRGETWDESHPHANRRVMTVPGREQGSEVMTEAMSGYTGGRRPNRWCKGKVEKKRIR